MNESETVQNENVYKLEQDSEDAMTEKLEEEMLSEDLRQNRESELLEAKNRIIALQNKNTLWRKKNERMTKRVFDIQLIRERLSNKTVRDNAESYYG